MVRNLSLKVKLDRHSSEPVNVSDSITVRPGIGRAARPGFSQGKQWRMAVQSINGKAVLGLRPMVLLLALLAASLVSAQEQPPQYGYSIVNRFPHSINAFTQGLFYHDGYLYEGTGKNGQSSLSRIDLDSGEVLQSKRLSRRYFGEGIELVGDRIYQLTWRANIVFVYDRESFDLLDSHYNPTEGWGLAWDGEHLILSDGTATLRFMDPENFSSQRAVEVTINGNAITNLNELEYINGEIWANVWQTDFILRIDPETGQVNSVVDLTGLADQTQLGSNEAVLNGIAWDAEQERLLVTGKHWAHLFEIELTGPR
jgi:glutamine cyclotransferase